MGSGPYDEELLKRALNECAQEPVHAPGAIQAHGVLVAVDEDLKRVLQVSANVAELLEVDVEEALEMRPVELLGQSLLRRARKEIAREGRAKGFATAPILRGGRRAFHVTAYRSDGALVLEIERDVREGVKRMLASLSEMVMQLSAAKDIDTLLDMLVRHARALSGNDRAVAYRFVEEWHGVVVAEDRAPHVGRFLGQHFPAGEIPEQVRALYLRNPVRFIQDVSQPSVPLVPALNPLTNKPLDMGDGVLRAVSPVHVQYLKNMGNLSSHSIAIRSGNVLWGLLSMHAVRPNPLPAHLRNGLLVLTQVATQRLFLLEKEKDEQFMQAVTETRSRLTRSQRRLPEPAELLEQQGKDWMALYRACGIALVYHDTMASIDLVPSRKYISAILELLRERASDGGVWATEHLEGEGDLPEGRHGCCGLLAVSLMRGVYDEGWLLIFRAEEPVVRAWAGQPKHRLKHEGDKVILTPRKSFDAWVDEVRGHSAPWREIEIRKARDLAEDLGILVAALEISHLRDEAERTSRELSRVNQRLGHIAHTDALTEVWNRRGIEDAIETQLALAEREGRPFAVFLFDIDHFKRINDTLGHPKGDEVLRRLAQVVSHELRRGDSIGRWGGEEFVFVASGTELEPAMALAERLRQRVEQQDFGVDGKVTVSVGVAAWRPGDSIDTLVERADEAVYEAKRSGRNRVCRESPPPPRSRERSPHADQRRRH